MRSAVKTAGREFLRHIEKGVRGVYPIDAPLDAPPFVVGVLATFHDRATPAAIVELAVCRRRKSSCARCWRAGGASVRRQIPICAAGTRKPRHQLPGKAYPRGGPRRRATSRMLRGARLSHFFHWKAPNGPPYSVGGLVTPATSMAARCAIGAAGGWERAVGLRPSWERAVGLRTSWRREAWGV